MNDPEILMDVHNHSNLSPDGSNDPEEMVRRATELGIRYYSLTDHLEINKFYDEEYLYEEPVKRASEISPALIKKYAYTVLSWVSLYRIWSLQKECCQAMIMTL